MKNKFTYIILTCLLILFTITGTGFASVNNYNFPSHGFSIDIPDDMGVITKENLEDYADYLTDDYIEAIKSGTMLFLAADDTVEIDCIAYSFETSKESSGMGDDYALLNLNQFNDTERQAYLESLATSFENSSGWSTLLDKSIYQSGDAYYTDIDFYNDVDDQRYYFSHFSTTYNGDYYVYRICYYDGQINENQKQKIKSILDSIVYTATDKQLDTMKQVQELIDESEERALSEARDKATLNAIKAMAIGIIVIVAFIFIKKKLL